jgi:hypothetical protein
MKLSPQTSPAQQSTSLEQAFTSVRQQLSGPSLANPLSAQMAAPPHWLELVQVPPSATVPLLGSVGVGVVVLLSDWQRPSVPQVRPLQQRESSVPQEPPSIKQQLRAPSSRIPLSAQTDGPLAWLHWLVVTQ